MDGPRAARAVAPLRLLTGRPGLDEITITAAEGRCLCFARQHRAVGTLADVLVTFGELGEVFKDSLWRECWGATYPMCADCWQATAAIAQDHRPHLVVRDHRQPAALPRTTDAGQR